MAITDYDATASNNTSVGGVNIQEGWSPADVNNSIRAIMADIAQGIADGDFASVSGFQAEDATLTALAGLVAANNDLILANGADSFTTLATTAYGRTLLGLANAAALASEINAVTVVSSNLSTNGHLALDLTGDGTANIKFNWGTGTFASTTSFQSAFATQCWGVIPFPTSLIGQSDESDEHMYVSSKSASSFTTAISGDYSSAPSLFFIAIGV